MQEDATYTQHLTIVVMIGRYKDSSETTASIAAVPAVLDANS